MRFVWVSALRELRRLRRDPLLLAVWIGTPLAAGLIMMTIFGGGKVTPKGTLLVADEDGSLVSSLVSGAFGQGPLGEMITVEKVGWEEGRRRIGRGGASALLRIPKGFGAAVLDGTAARIELVKNPSQSILPDIIEEAAAMLPEAAFYLQALAGDRLRTFTGGSAPPDAQVAEAAIAFNRLGRAVSAYVDPLRIELVDKSPESQPATGVSTFAVALLRGMIVLAVMFLGNGFAAEVWRERRQGTLQRLLAAPARIEGHLLGRCLAVGAIAGVTAAVGLTLGNRLVSTPAWRIAAGSAFMVPVGISIYLLLQVFSVLASSERAASILANLVMFPLAMLGGTFFPFSVMPAWMAEVGRWTPNGWAVTQFGLLMEGPVDAARLATAFGGAILAGAAVFLLAAWRLRRGFAA